MGRSPCCEKSHTNRGAWSKEEDQRLIAYIRANGEGCWRSLPKSAGLQRCGKSCRLRWINYLRPDLKRGNFTEEEDELIIKLHSYVGNKWSLIASRLQGRTDNEIKNYWNTHIKRKLISQGLDPQTHRPFNSTTTTPVSVSVHRNLEFRKSVYQSLSTPVLTSEPNATLPDSVQDDGSSSGTTIETLTEIMERDRSSGSLDLELSIGLGPFRSRSPTLSGNSDESRPQTTKAVCMCGQLRFLAMAQFCHRCEPNKDEILQANPNARSISFNNNTNSFCRMSSNCGSFSFMRM